MAIRGYTQGAYWSGGSGSVAWPAGTQVGDTAWLGIAATTSSRPRSQPKDTTGWILAKRTPSTRSWTKVLTSADLAGPLQAEGHIAFLVVLPGVWPLGQVTNDRHGATSRDAGGHVIVFGRGRSTLTPTGGKLGTDVINDSYNSRRNNVWLLEAAEPGFVGLSGFNGSDSDGFEFRPPAGPLQPQPTAPPPGAQIDPAQPLTLRWLHQSQGGGRQSSFRVAIIELGTTTWLYLKSDGTLSTSSQPATSSAAGQATVSAGQLASGKTYRWTVTTTEDGVVWSEWSVEQEIVAVSAPTVSSVSVSSPAGTVTPTVSWVPSIGSGVQTLHQVRVTPATSGDANTGVMWDSGTQSGAVTSLVVPDQGAGWTNGQSLKFWVRVWQTGGLVSPWKSATGAVSWTPPSAPTAVSIIDGQPPKISVTGLTADLPVRIETSADGGVTWQAERVAAASGTTLQVDVPLMRFGVSILARAQRADSAGRWSTWRTSGAVTPTDRSVYLVGDDGEYIKVLIGEIDVPGEPHQPTKVYYPLGGGPRVDYAREQGRSGTFQVILLDAAEVDALLSFLRTHDVWTRRLAPEHDRNRTYSDTPKIRMVRTSPLELDRVGRSFTQLRTLDISWVEVL